MAIGDKLSELMELRNTNPNQLSKTTGVNVNTVYGIIRRNNTKVNLDDLQSICDELGVNLDYFAEKENSEIKKAPPELSRDAVIDDIVDRFAQLLPEDRQSILDYTEFLIYRRNLKNLAAPLNPDLKVDPEDS